uniref:Uncharacterized protein n=2 Tax=Acrobeloides nanus TaxID=290746 RepID=A0A914CRY7_9BILA
MPIVVEDQLDAFRKDPIMVQLAQNTAIHYSGCLHGKDAERRQTFLQNCANMKLPIAIPSNGINLDLSLSTMHSHETEVEFESDLIFNGVCVKLKGRINKAILTGVAKLEFDAERAEQERQRMQERLRLFEARISELRNMVLQ